ncbi:MAG: hypothetical protein V1720_09795 [bacterium]
MKTAKFYLLPLGLSLTLMLQGCFTMLPTKQVHYDYPIIEEPDGPCPCPPPRPYPPPPGPVPGPPPPPPSPPDVDPPSHYQPSPTMERDNRSGHDSGGHSNTRDNGNGRSSNHDRRSR